MSRPETGTMEFDGDWRGVFIRGDNAFYYASMLQMLIESSPSTIEKEVCKNLLEILQNSKQHGDPINPDIIHQQMKKFDDCVISQQYPNESQSSQENT